MHRGSDGEALPLKEAFALAIPDDYERHLVRHHLGLAKVRDLYADCVELERSPISSFRLSLKSLTKNAQDPSKSKTGLLHHDFPLPLC